MGYAPDPAREYMRLAMEHTREPWKAIETQVLTENALPPAPQRRVFVVSQCMTCCGSGVPVSLPYATSKANARRIVSAVNACEGIPTEALEGGVVKDLLEFHGDTDTYFRAAIAKIEGRG